MWKMMDGEELLRFVWGQEFVADALVDVGRWYVIAFTDSPLPFKCTHSCTILCMPSSIIIYLAADSVISKALKRCIHAHRSDRLLANPLIP